MYSWSRTQLTHFFQRNRKIGRTLKQVHRKGGETMKKNDTSYFYVIFFISEFQDIAFIYWLTLDRYLTSKLTSLKIQIVCMHRLPD